MIQLPQNKHTHTRLLDCLFLNQFLTGTVPSLSIQLKNAIGGILFLGATTSLKAQAMESTGLRSVRNAPEMTIK